VVEVHAGSDTYRVSRYPQQWAAHTQPRHGSSIITISALTLAVWHGVESQLRAWSSPTRTSSVRARLTHRYVTSRHPSRTGARYVPVTFVSPASDFYSARYATAVLGVVILSLCPSHACFVTNPKNRPAIFFIPHERAIILVF